VPSIEVQLDFLVSPLTSRYGPLSFLREETDYGKSVQQHIPYPSVCP